MGIQGMPQMPQMPGMGALGSELHSPVKDLIFNKGNGLTTPMKVGPINVSAFGCAGGPGAALDAGACKVAEKAGIPGADVAGEGIKAGRTGLSAIKHTALPLAGITTTGAASVGAGVAATAVTGTAAGTATFAIASGVIGPVGGFLAGVVAHSVVGSLSGMGASLATTGLGLGLTFAGIGASDLVESAGETVVDEVATKVGDKIGDKFGGLEDKIEGLGDKLEGKIEGAEGKVEKGLDPDALMNKVKSANLGPPGA